MSDLMLFGVLRMPYEMAMSGEISRRQFYDRVKEALERLEVAEARVAELEAARATPAPVEGQALPPLKPIDYDRDMDRTYIPLPGGWEIQTKGKGSSFRLAHIGSRTRWIVMDDNLHEPLEAMARDARQAIEADRRARGSIDSQLTGEASTVKQDAQIAQAQQVERGDA